MTDNNPEIVDSTPVLLQRILACHEGLPSRRILVALAGAPGSGKSTLAAELHRRLEERSPGVSAVVPMDGYHLDDSLLIPAGLRPVKGAPNTFDVGGLASLLQRLQGDEDPIYFPVFDRNRELAVNSAASVRSTQRIILVEGNYLLLDVPEWRDLAGVFDLSVFIDVPEPVLRERLVQRWLRYGLDAAAALAKAQGNDLPNGAQVRKRLRRPDVIFRAEPTSEGV